MTEAELLADILVQNTEILELDTPSIVDSAVNFQQAVWKKVNYLAVSGENVAYRGTVFYYHRLEYDEATPPNITLDLAYYYDKKPQPKNIPKDSAQELLEDYIKALTGYLEHKVISFDQAGKKATVDVLINDGADSATWKRLLARKVGANPIEHWEVVA